MHLTTADKIQVITSGTADTHVTASYVDHRGPNLQVGHQQEVIAAAATTDVVDAPRSGQREIETLAIRNLHASSSQTVTVQQTDGTTTTQLIRVTLQAGEELLYGKGQWKVLDAAGGQKDAARAGRFLREVVYTTAGAISHTTGPDCNKIEVEVLGGGGGGGGCTSVAAAAGAAGGGGAGSRASKVFDVSPNTAYTGAVGAAGAGVSADAGTNGGDSTFTVGATTITGKGGTGGPQNVPSNALTAGLGGAGGTVGTNGDWNTVGESGHPGVVLIVAGAVGVSGAGGSTPYGRGGAGIAAAGAGANAAGPGAGGGGALTGASAARAGGNGVAGQVIVREYA